MLHTWHMQYRSHSTHANNAYLNELYKKDANGQPAFLSPTTRTSLATWDDGVYEPIWINPIDGAAYGIDNGDRVLVSNDRGQIYASAHVTQRAQPGRRQHRPGRLAPAQRGWRRRRWLRQHPHQRSGPAASARA